jgi:site-specific recombinase XerD
MATLIDRNGVWYARIRYRVNHKQKEKQVPLKTSLRTKAITRRIAVEQYENDIVNGVVKPFQFKKLFKWLNNSGSTQLIKQSIGDIIPDYLDYRFCKVRQSTAKRDKTSLNQLTAFIGNSKPIAELTYKDIEGKDGLIHHLQNNGYKDSGINISLRHIKIFFNWLYQKEKLISETISFDMINEGEQLPRYLNENELKAIYDLDWLDDFFKRAFVFYEHTGCRPIEPFLGELMGDWLIIDSVDSKGKGVRQIRLNETLKSIFMELTAFRDNYEQTGSNKPNETAYHRLATIMRKVTRELKFKGKSISLKSFRHTYGIRRVTITGNIYQVAKEMGHKYVTTTQRYLEYPEERRLDDFPSLKEYIEKDENKTQMAMWDTDLRDFKPYLRASS